MVWGKRRRNLWDDMRRMQDEMDSLFDRVLQKDPWFEEDTEYPMLSGGGSGALSNYRQPLADMWETDDEMVTVLEIPGADKEDIKINATEDGVEVKVEKKEEHEEDDKKGIYRFERSYSGFYRYFSLPEGSDAEKIDAKYQNGVLELHIPKTGITKKKVKKIEVK